MGVDIAGASARDLRILRATVEAVSDLLSILSIDSDPASADVAGPAIVDGVRALVDENRRLREMIAVRAKASAQILRVAVTLKDNRERGMGMACRNSGWLGGRAGGREGVGE